MKSKILLSEIVENKERYRSANKFYYPVVFEMPDGAEIKGLFTYHEIAKAIRRGNRNLEDFNEDSLLDKLFDLL